MKSQFDKPVSKDDHRTATLGVEEKQQRDPFAFLFAL